MFSKEAVKTMIATEKSAKIDQIVFL